MKNNIVCIVGTRPEVIKMAPVVRALRAAPEFNLEVLCSGQHRDLLAPLAAWFEIGFDDDLRVMSDNQSLGELTARLTEAFERRFAAARPDLVIAQGDTTTVMCAALVCFYRGIAFAHVEAGLRTFNLGNPFPEDLQGGDRLARCISARAARSITITGTNAWAQLPHLNGYSDRCAAFHSRGSKSADSPPYGQHPPPRIGAKHNAPLAAICQAVSICAEFPHLKVLYQCIPIPIRAAYSASRVTRR